MGSFGSWRVSEPDHRARVGVVLQRGSEWAGSLLHRGGPWVAAAPAAGSGPEDGSGPWIHYIQ